VISKAKNKQKVKYDAGNPKKSTMRQIPFSKMCVDLILIRLDDLLID